MSIWKADFEGHEIKIENSWRGEKLYVNSRLQDEKINFSSSSDLTGHVMSKDGKRLPIKVHIGGIFTIGCRLFVDDEKVEVAKVK